MESKAFGSIKPNRVSSQVAEQIKNSILEGKLKSGDKLPAERELCKMIGVERLSLREGLRILESAGILETKYCVGSGTYVSQIGLKDLVEKFSEFLRFGSVDIDELTETRLEISLVILKYFIKRASEEDIQLLEDCVQETERRLECGLEAREQTILFHELIALGSKNTVFIMLHHSLMNLLKQILSKFVSSHEHSAKILENQEKILRHLKEKDYETASVVMKEHLKYVAERLQSPIDHSGDLPTR